MDTRQCACGCGQEIAALDVRDRPRFYVWGHVNRGKSNTWLRKPDASVNRRAFHERANSIKRNVYSCEWERIGECGGPLDVCHVNGNETDNDPHNLLKLCRSHHRLLDAGRIDPANPIMPPFKISGGKRRYR